MVNLNPSICSNCGNKDHLYKVRRIAYRLHRYDRILRWFKIKLDTRNESYFCSMACAAKRAHEIALGLTHCDLVQLTITETPLKI